MAQAATVNRAGRPGRNDICPCGSGRKYKRCCLLRVATSAPASDNAVRYGNPTAPRAGIRKDDAGDAFTQALEFRNRGMVLDAEIRCNQCLAVDPLHTGALRLLAAIANTSGRSREAAELLTQAVRAGPLDVAAHVDLGHTLFGLGRIAEAVGALRTAVSIEPASLEAQTSLGGALAHLGRMAEAEAALRTALELDDRCAPAHTNLGELLRSSGRVREARESLESALRLAPEDLLTRLAYAEVLYELGEFESAAGQCREILSQGPGSSRVYAKLGLALLGTGDQVGALEAVRMAVRLDPNSADTHIVCAYALLQYGHFREAITCAEEAVRLAHTPPGHMLHGLALATSGNLDDGITRFRAGFGQDKSPAECVSVMGDMLQKFGHTDSARECLSYGLEIEPNNPTLRHQVAALRGEATERADDEYVAQLFDAFADSFDSKLLGQLMYAAPRLVRDAILAHRPATGPLDILDLGCGTGLVGVELSLHASTLVGVDLSEKMLQRARDRNIYTRLTRNDLGSALLAEPASSYDIVAAADVFVYIGRLDEVVPAVSRVLRPKGVFVFTVEADRTQHTDHPLPSPGYRLTSTGRFAHTAGYLTDLAARSAFEVKSVREVRLRSEMFRPVAGLLLVLARAA